MEETYPKIDEQKTRHFTQKIWTNDDREKTNGERLVMLRVRKDYVPQFQIAASRPRPADNSAGQQIEVVVNSVAIKLPATELLLATCIREARGPLRRLSQVRKVAG